MSANDPTPKPTNPEETLTWVEIFYFSDQTRALIGPYTSLSSDTPSVGGKLIELLEEEKQRRVSAGLREWITYMLGGIEELEGRIFSMTNTSWKRGTNDVFATTLIYERNLFIANEIRNISSETEQLELFSVRTRHIREGNRQLRHDPIVSTADLIKDYINPTRLAMGFSNLIDTFRDEAMALDCANSTARFATGFGYNRAIRAPEHINGEIVIGLVSAENLVTDLVTITALVATKHERLDSCMSDD
ncbi:Nn.00g074550.m01.CDS01 [Neocucurbitaria sp. VM-36]